MGRLVNIALMFMDPLHDKIELEVFIKSVLGGNKLEDAVSHFLSPVQKGTHQGTEEQTCHQGHLPPNYSISVNKSLKNKIYTNIPPIHYTSLFLEMGTRDISKSMKL